ncbi:hypothetical protein V8J88_22555 [Massilia sp. W12]|uniref:hypothetical protein n=1 Tax=Massilia sp. W12 TaxID=3126507 RepID=UPI0030CA81BE
MKQAETFMNSKAHLFPASALLLYFAYLHIYRRLFPVVLLTKQQIFSTLELLVSPPETYSTYCHNGKISKMLFCINYVYDSVHISCVLLQLSNRGAPARFLIANLGGLYAPRQMDKPKTGKKNENTNKQYILQLAARASRQKPRRAGIAFQSGNSQKVLILPSSAKSWRFSGISDAPAFLRAGISGTWPGACAQAPACAIPLCLAYEQNKTT